MGDAIYNSVTNIILENMPAEVCGQCGEVLIRSDVLDEMQEVVWSETAPRRTARCTTWPKSLEIMLT